MKGIIDKKLIEFCLKEERILITLDTDFINTNLPNKGIIVLRTRKQGKNAVENLFLDFLNNFNLENSKNKIVIVEPTQIRVRKN